MYFYHCFRCVLCCLDNLLKPQIDCNQLEYFLNNNNNNNNNNNDDDDEL